MISVENVSKQYRLGLIGGGTLKGDLARWWARVRKQPDPHLKIGQEHLAERMGEEFWALRDVSFEVKQGEVLGIIGRNGAGKSTLLKILSRVTAPTEGRIRLAGRVASLLEVGTGFHPELTGRENTYLNGAILGMTKREIDRKFDEIVAFSEVEQFIDTPVKRYSSGMYVRLAFAVAAHLDPEILIVDEVLAVGDAAFQKKCLGKMGDVARGGRTVLFVSHNMASVSVLCTSALLLSAGAVEATGTVSSMTAAYLRQHVASCHEWVGASAAEQPAQFEHIAVLASDGSVATAIGAGSALRLQMVIVLRDRCPGLRLSVSLADDRGEWLFASAPEDAGIVAPMEPGRYVILWSCPSGILLARQYAIQCSLWRKAQGALHVVDDLRCDVQQAACWAYAGGNDRAGQLAIRCDWSITSASCQPH
jgi:lipopolysaccharide transport system ATP-binding protein